MLNAGGQPQISLLGDKKLLERTVTKQFSHFKLNQQDIIKNAQWVPNARTFVKLFTLYDDLLK